jgi:glycosyltransferase involved in cell wall biosynthesis
MAKRICMVAYTQYRSDARPRREAEALVGRGDEVDFIALGEGGGREERVEGVSLVELASTRYRGASALAYLESYGSFFLRALAELTRRHTRRHYDVVQVHTMPDFMVFTAALVKPLGVKVVLDVHDTMPELYQSKFGIGPNHLLSRALEWQERLSCAFADRVICVHGPHKELLVRRGVPAQKITVILNVPDPRVFGAPSDGFEIARSGPPRLVYHGTIAERLGLDVALRALRRVLSRFPEARFDIIGTGDYAARTHELIRELELSDAVHFADRQFPLAEIPGLVAGATLGIVPNRNDPATRMMLPVKLLEYAHLGIPAVAPRLPAITHYFGDDALAFYEPGDARSMSGAICDALADPEGSARRRHAASAFARRHAWDTLKHDLFSVIDH